MKTYNTKPLFDVEQFLCLEHIIPWYSKGAEEAPNLLTAWLDEQKKTPYEKIYLRTHRDFVIRHFGAMFLFECGRIYGIRQERERRKGCVFNTDPLFK